MLDGFLASGVLRIASTLDASRRLAGMTFILSQHEINCHTFRPPANKQVGPRIIPIISVINGTTASSMLTGFTLLKVVATTLPSSDRPHRAR